MKVVCRMRIIHLFTFTTLLLSYHSEFARIFVIISFSTYTYLQQAKARVAAELNTLENSEAPARSLPETKRSVTWLTCCVQRFKA